MKKRIFAISGSNRPDSSNVRLIRIIADLMSDDFEFTIFEGLASLPHFMPDESTDSPPPAVVALRRQIEEADGVLICTPEYVFSIPGSLKNALEWCVSTIIFENKATGLITAAAHGEKGHAELKLILRTVNARFTEKSTLLIQGIKGKIDESGHIKDTKTLRELQEFTGGFSELVNFRPGDSF